MLIIRLFLTENASVCAFTVIEGLSDPGCDDDSAVFLHMALDQVTGNHSNNRLCALLILPLHLSRLCCIPVW
jgi:hypothetical protein